MVERMGTKKDSDSWLAGVVKPTLIIDEKKARRNIQKIAEKARRSGVQFRPHFKTHQLAVVGEWFRDYGVDRICVSSVDMAVYFARHGWNDITIAFPLNIRQIETINSLAERIQLNLLVESLEVVQFLQANFQAEAQIWIKIDIGNRRTGIDWQDSALVTMVAAAVHEIPNLHLKGLLTHSGHTYRLRSVSQIKTLHHETVERLQRVKKSLASASIPGIEISIGDTPSASVVEDFAEVDEIRPGNFVYYDLMQLEIGACLPQEIAVGAACPVVAKHPSRSEIVIYGGAVHFSKEHLTNSRGEKYFGKMVFPQASGWGNLNEGNYVSAISQEHGIVHTDAATFSKIQVGDLVVVLPIHSCLMADLLKEHYWVLPEDERR